MFECIFLLYSSITFSPWCQWCSLRLGLLILWSLILLPQPPYASVVGTDKRRAKYIIYLFSLLSSTWTHIWSNWIHYCNWHLVCGLCSRWATTWTGYLQSRKFHFLAGFFLFLFFWIHLMYNSREWLWILLLSFFFFFGPSQNF